MASGPTLPVVNCRRSFPSSGDNRLASNVKSRKRTKRRSALPQEPSDSSASCEEGKAPAETGRNRQARQDGAGSFKEPEAGQAKAREPAQVRVTAPGRQAPTHSSPKTGARRRPLANADPSGLGEMAPGMLAAIVQSSDAAIIGKTLDGIVTSWNPSAERIFGYSAAEMIGKPIHVVVGTGLPAKWRRSCDRVRRGERVEHFETERRRKDGRLIHISLTVSPILDERGRIIGASKIARDITGRKSTEAQLQGQDGAARGVHPCLESGTGHGADTRGEDPVLGAWSPDPLRMVGGGSHRTGLP